MTKEQKFNSDVFKVVRLHRNDYITAVAAKDGQKVLVDLARDPQDLREDAILTRERADLLDALADYNEDYIEDRCKDKFYSLQHEFGSKDEMTLTWDTAPELTKKLIRDTVMIDVAKQH